MELHFLKAIWSDIIILKNNKDIGIIDTGFEEQFEDIKKYLDKMEVKTISFILLTHFHRDHYGSIEKLVKNYNVEKVYFKDYSGLDSTTAWGTPADDNYRIEQIDKCIEIKNTIKENSKLVQVEDLKFIKFGEHKLNLYNNTNSIKEIYEDKNFEDYYHKYTCNENQNSMAIFLKVNGVNIFFGGDISDKESTHPKKNYINYQIASAIQEKIDIYKVPHHGGFCSNSEKTLNIYKPQIAIITNEREFSEKESCVCQDLVRANKNVKILLTENNNVVINISDEGKIDYKYS